MEVIEQSAIAEDVFGEHFESISRYVDILASRGVDWGLLGPREVDRLWTRHILNSVAIERLLPSGATVVDVGSGAGLPGIPLAILRPDLRVTLLEPLLRRSNFLSDVVAELGLDARVRVVRERAEEHRNTYGVVTGRAVAGLPKLIEWCAGLIAPGGQLVAIKGEAAEDEVVDANAVLRRKRLSAEVIEVRAHSDAEPTRVVRIK